jgi:excisionase family DNA binding protein
MTTARDNEPIGAIVIELPTLLTRGRVSDLLEVCERTVDRMIGRGELDTVRIGKNVRITRASLERLLRAGASWSAP